jgi:hypothetical protein
MRGVVFQNKTLSKSHLHNKLKLETLNALMWILMANIFIDGLIGMMSCWDLHINICNKVCNFDDRLIWLFICLIVIALLDGNKVGCLCWNFNAFFNIDHFFIRNSFK